MGLQDRVLAALAKADMKQWEMFRVDNSDSKGAPLDISERDGDMGKTLERRQPVLA